MSTILSKIKQIAENQHEDIVKIRRHMHQYPELSFHEHETSKFISQKLDEFGLEYKSGIAGTGLCVLIKGANPDKKTVALRADFDALPIEEANDVPYKSKNKGVMHACGHDVHTSSLLGAAKILNELKNEFEGTVKLIFQPAEEKLPGGASIMISEGILENPKPASIFGQHVMPELETGKVGFRPGKYMASADEIYMTIKGKGGHAAMPDTLIDPVIISAHILTSFQQIISRNANPEHKSVLSFGKITADGATNVIPDEVKIEGTFRTFDENWRYEAHKIIERMATQIAQAMGGKCEIEIRKGYPCLFNDPELTSKSMKLAMEYLGSENVVELPMRATAEDFAYYTQLARGCFYRLGTGNISKGITSSIHTPTFDIDENALTTGMGLLAFMAISDLMI